MKLRRLIRRAILTFETWRLCKRLPRLAEARRAEREATRRRNTQAIHRAREDARLAVIDALRGVTQ